MSSTDTSANVTDAGAASLERPSPLGARTVALQWVSAYLALSGIVLGVGGHVWLAAVHAVLIALALVVSRPRGQVTRMTGDLLPLVAAPALYGEIPLLLAALAHGPVVYHDRLIQGWELWVFGTQPARALAPAIPFAPLSEFLHAGYLAYYGVIFLPPLFLFARGERRGLGQTVLALTIVATTCWAIFALFPVEGPRYAWGVSSLVPDGPVRRATLALLAAGSSRGAAFPSSHMAIAMVQVTMAFRWQRRVAWVLTLMAVLIGIGAVYGGFHYAVDMITGGLFGAIIGVTVLRLSKTAKP